MRLTRSMCPGRFSSEFLPFGLFFFFLRGLTSLYSVWLDLNQLNSTRLFFASRVPFAFPSRVSHDGSGVTPAMPSFAAVACHSITSPPPTKAHARPPGPLTPSEERFILLLTLARQQAPAFEAASCQSRRIPDAVQGVDYRAKSLLGQTRP